MDTSKDRPTLTEHDQKDHWRCPLLGDAVKFSYCRRMNQGLPCHKLKSCWGDRIDVDRYLVENFTPEEVDLMAAAGDKGRLGAIFDTLNRVYRDKSKP